MVPIKHILNETGVSEIFKLIVPDGDHAGTYIIKEPEGWNLVDSIVDIDEKFLNVVNFIIGETTKIKLSQFTDPVGYNIVKNVYKEKGGDGQLIFKWIAVKNEVEYDLLQENFELNLNKYNDAFDKSMKFIEVEIIKNEAQNKFITREDTTVDIFSDKDLDNEDIDPVGTVNIGYKKGFKTLSNFYTYDISQFSHVDTPRTVQSFSFLRSDGYEFGDNTNNYAGRKNPPAGGSYIDQGPFVATNITLSRLKTEISNLRYLARRGDNVTPNVSLYAIIKYAGSTEKQIPLKPSVPLAIGGINYGEIKIENEIFDIENLQPGRSLYFEVLTNENVAFAIDAAQDNTSIEVTTNLESPMVKTPAVRLKDALNQIAKSYTSGEITIESNILSSGGAFFNTSISTGMYLRGLPPLYLSQKLKTSFSKLFGDGVSKLMALGYDILNDKLIVEELDYFFKDIMVADFSEKQYLREGYKIEHDKEIGFNNILSGSKKYSTNLKFDIKNFNTSLEISTPIKSNKNKLDIQTDLIIDEYKIQELIEDKSSSTNDNDDDMVLVDMVDVSNVWDSGVFEDCIHSIDAGNLLLNCTSTAFDTTLIEVGKSVEITEGNNSGTWTVLSIEGSKMKVSKSTGIWEGVADTPIKYQIDTLTKNRTDEGFTGMGTTVRDPETCTNIRHNPKYQLARWWPYFGSGLRKKGNTELLKVANYKNNSEAKMTIVAPEMPNELQGEITVGNDELLSRLRDHKATFFNGERIEITFNRVTFEEFMDLYNNWKFGAENKRLNSRGYIKCNTPEGIYDIYPFGSGAFSHSKAKNTLSIKGKIKGKSVDNPVLLSVTQIDADTVDLTWDYNADYINPVIKIQYSTDGVNWNTLKEVVNVKSDSVTSSIFETFMTGDEVIFRIVANTPDFYNKVSNTINIDWLFNDWVFREISRSENINCSYSYLIFEIFGSGDFEITWDFASLPGGGSGSVIDLADNSTVVSFDSIYGPDYTEVQTTTLNLSDSSVMYSIQVKNTDNDGTRPIKCPILENAIFVEAKLLITIDSLTDSKTKEVEIKARTTKGWIDTSPFDPE